MRLPLRILLICLIANGLSYSTARAEERDSTQQETLAEARALIGQLSDSSYKRREAAAERLAELGVAARPALEESLKDPHAETRLRVRRILSRMEQNKFELLVAEFLADAEGDQQYELPQWPRFREQVGDGIEARTLFVEMLRSEGDLLATVANSPRAAASAFQMRCQQLQVESSASQQEIPRASLAAVLFVGADERVPMPNGVDSLLYRFCSHSSVENVLQDKTQQPLMRRIVGAWIASGNGGYYSLRLSMQHELPEGLEAAEKMLDGSTPSYYRQYALLTFAKLGDKSHIPRLKKLLTDGTVCTTHRVNNETFQTQFRDIALVAILHLYGQDPKNFGFERIRPHSQYVYSPYTLGFTDEEQRKATFAQWEKFRQSLDETGE